ncbi:MAG: NAD(P)/FAD-dependent oxidoreductase [Muribaculaceae bacterium]|nr:NAD(P)/FAD-dependent oxidoreductase [Muribaculaceae bacterium]
MTDNNLKEITLSLMPSQASNPSLILKELQKKDGRIKSFKIVRKSIDARKQPVKINLALLVSDQNEIIFDYPVKKYERLPENAPQVVIIGAGPAGLFAGLRAIELGLKPIIVERGKDVDSRRIDIANISRNSKVDPDSNYCFGEGGAGAFSDGKLYTRSKKRGSIREVLEILHQFGASEEILIHSHPHIGSDKLPKVIRNIREKIRECGGEVKFGCRMEEILLEDNKAVGIKTSENEIIKGPVFLATGHSARDTFKMLHRKGVKMEPKGIAIGVRLEHPQPLIDKMQYHSSEGRGEFLPAAEYSFVNQVDGRGVYSFCMCPGGVIVPAVSEDGQIVVNGMSASARSGKWANSGYVVELHPGDISGFEESGPFEMLKLQESLEKIFYEESQDGLNAPAQRINDFIVGTLSDSLPSTSYAPGLHSADFNSLFPKEISERLKSGLIQIGKKCRDFVSNKGLMIGLESRTSSPIRIPRDPDSLSHVSIEDLYPVGEGAGYAGGIVSSAIDGMNCIDAYLKKLNSNA